MPGTTFLRIALYLICTKVCKGPEINDGWRHKLTDSFEIDDSLEPFYQQLTSALFTHSERYLIIFDRLHYSGASSTPRRNQFFIQYTPQMRRLAKRPKNSTFRQSSHSGSKQTRRKTKKKETEFFSPDDPFRHHFTLTASRQPILLSFLRTVSSLLRTFYRPGLSPSSRRCENNISILARGENCSCGHVNRIFAFLCPNA